MGKAHSDQRDRTLSLIRLLYQESDEDHPFTTQQIVQRLTQAGISVERKSIYRDLAAMNQHGFPVAYRRGAGWYAAGQPFTLAELQGVADAVAVYRGLPSALREVLLEKLTALAPQPQRRRLCRPVALEPPRGEAPDRVRPVLDRIYAALQSRTALRFLPVTYNNQGTRCLGEACLVTPKGMLWSQERHQLLGWNHQTRKLTLYRPDRMHQVEVTDVPAQGPEADLSQWLAAPFGPDLRLQTTVCLRCRTGLAGEILDRWGREVTLVPVRDGFTVTAPAVLGPAFWGWLAAQGEKVTLLSPTWAVEAWKQWSHPRVSGLGVAWKQGESAVW